MGGLARIAARGLVAVARGGASAATKLKNRYPNAIGVSRGSNGAPIIINPASTGAKSRIIDTIKNNKLKVLVGGAGALAVAPELLSAPGAAMDAFAGGEGDAEVWLHAAPEAGRTLFYPVTGNGNYDDVAGVDELDAATQELNQATFGYDSESVRSFCDGACTGGCVDTITTPALFSSDAYTAYYTDVSDALEQTTSMMNNNSEESWVQALIQSRYGSGGTLDVSDFSDKFGAIVTATQPLYETTNSSGSETHTALRTLVKNIRANLAAGYADGESGFSWGDFAKDVGGGAALGAVFGSGVLSAPGALIGGGIGLGQNMVSSIVNDRFPEEGVAALEESWSTASASVSSALEANDEAIVRFNEAVSKLVITENAPSDDSMGGIIPTKKDDTPEKKKKEDDTPKVLGTPLSPVTTSPSTPSTPSTPADKDLGTENDPFKDWMENTPTPSTGNGSSPFSSPGMSDPGMSSGSPTSTPGLGDLGQTPTEDISPLSDAEEEPLEDMESLSEPLEDAELEEAPLDEAPIDGETELSEDETTEGEEEPVDGTEEEPPVEEGDVPAEPTDEEKRTVELADGRMVTFPNEQLADMVREMVAAGTENPTSVYMAADAAGFDLPPMGQDIGSPISSMDIQEGDIVNGPDGMGVYVGNSEVLMENGEIRPVEEVSRVEDGSHGVFRLEGGDESPADALSGTPQEVGAEPSVASEEGTSVNASGGEPGMPGNDAPDVTTADTDSSVPSEDGSTDSFTGTDPLDALGL